MGGLWWVHLQASCSLSSRCFSHGSASSPTFAWLSFVERCEVGVFWQLTFPYHFLFLGVNEIKRIAEDFEVC